MHKNTVDKVKKKWDSSKFCTKNRDCTCPSKSGTVGEYAYIGTAIFSYE